MDSRPPPASHPPQPLNFCDHLHYPSARIPYRSSKIQSGPFIYPTTIQTPITTLITTTHLNYQIFQLQFCHNSAINLFSHPSWNIWKMAQTLIYSTNHISPSSLEAIFPQSSTTLTTSVQWLLYLLPATFLTVFPPPFYFWSHIADLSFFTTHLSISGSLIPFTAKIPPLLLWVIS